MREKGFIPHSYESGAPRAWEYHPVSAIGEMVEGMALVMADGALAKATGSTKPEYIGMFRGNASAGDTIPVMRVDGAVLFETTFAADNGDVNIGDKVTIHTDALRVTATTAGGVATVVRKVDDNDNEGDHVLVRFA